MESNTTAAMSHKPYEILISLENKNGVQCHFTMFMSYENRPKPGHGIPEGVEMTIQSIQRKSGTLNWIEKITPLDYSELLGVTECEPFSAKCGITGSAEFSAQRITMMGKKHPEIPKRIVSQDIIVFDGLVEVHVFLPAKSTSELSLNVMAQSRNNVELFGTSNTEPFA